MKKKFLLLFLMLVLLLPNILNAQVRQGVASYRMPPTQDFQFARYGDTPVNLHTGTATVSIPIYEYNDPDFDLSISMDYASSGYKPNDAVGISGLGWYLNAGGMVTREVRGLPDEFSHTSGPKKGASPGTTWEYYYGFSFISEELVKEDYTSTLVSLPFQNSILKGGVASPLCTTTGKDSQGNETLKFYDTSPDIFNFKVGKHSGQFIITPEGPKIYSTSQPAGEYSIDYGLFYFIDDDTERIPDKYNEGELHIDYITIKTGDGFTYKFGGDETLRSHSLPTRGLTNPQLMGVGFQNRTKTSWPLCSIEAPNGRRIEFKYDDLTKYIKSVDPNNPKSITLKESLTLLVEPNTFGLRTYDNDENVGSYICYNTIKGYEDKNYYGNFISNLVKINIDNKLYIDFIYDKEKESELEKIVFAGKDPYRNYNLYNAGFLDKIEITDSFTNNVIDAYSLDYTYTDHVEGNNVRLLHKISKLYSSITYDFKYYKKEKKYPYKGVINLDNWGYFNQPVTTEISYDAPTTEAEGSVAHVSGEPNFEGAVYGMLKEVIYPTKGKRVFEYENHDVSYSIAKTSSSPTETFLVGPTATVKEVGGLRIKSITDVDRTGDTVGIRKFSYRKDGYSTGISISFPWYFESPMAYSASGNQGDRYSRGSIMRNFHLFNNTVDNTHIEYSEVTEINRDNSYIVHRFSSFQDTPDINYPVIAVPAQQKEAPRILNTSAEQRPSSLHLQRGKLIAKSYYNSDGEKVAEDEYIYDKTKNLKTFTVLDSYDDYVLQHKLIIDDYDLTEHITKQYFGNDSIVNTTKYGYNNRGQLNMTETRDNMSRRIVQKTQYVGDVLAPSTIYWDMYYGQHLRNAPIRIQVTDETSGALISAVKYDYWYFMEMNYTGVIKPVRVYRFNSDERPTSIPANFGFDNLLSLDEKFKNNNKGRLIEHTARDGSKTRYVWGYGNIYPVAVIKNANVLTDSDIYLLELEKQHKQGLPYDTRLKLYDFEGCLVNVYEYRPFVGLIREIDPSGKKTIYDYDRIGRLVSVSDEAGPIENYHYHIQ